MSQGLSSEKQKGLVQLYSIKMLTRDACVVSLNIGVIVLLRKEANCIFISLPLLLSKVKGGVMAKSQINSSPSQKFLLK